MPISYPSTYTIINNITTSAGGGDGNATSLVGIPIFTSSLDNGQFLLYNQYENRWENQYYGSDFTIPVLSTPTNASGTSAQELTRFNIALPLSEIKTKMLISYSIENNRTGSLQISSSVDGAILTIPLSGTSEVGGHREDDFYISGSAPYYLMASSSNTDSNFKIYNFAIAFTFP